MNVEVRTMVFRTPEKRSAPCASAVMPRPRPRMAVSGLLSACLLLIAIPGEAGLKTAFALHRPSTTQFFFDYDDGGAVVDRSLAYGAPGDVALLADMDGDTIADLVLYRNGVWY